MLDGDKRITKTQVSRRKSMRKDIYKSKRTKRTEITSWALIVVVVLALLSPFIAWKMMKGTFGLPFTHIIIKVLYCHASNYSSHLLQLYCKINPTSPSYHLS